MARHLLRVPRVQAGPATGRPGAGEADARARGDAEQGRVAPDVVQREARIAGDDFRGVEQRMERAAVRRPRERIERGDEARHGAPVPPPDDVQRVRHGGVSTQRRPLAADGLGGRRRPPLVAGQPHVTLRIKKIAERRTIWGAAAPRGPNSRRRAAAAKRIFQGAQEGKSQRPGGFLGPSCGCRASTGRAFCRRATRPNRTARGSKPTDLVLSGPRVYPLC